MNIAAVYRNWTISGPSERATPCDVTPMKSVVIGIWRDWLWLDPVDYSDAAPFTGRARDYDLIRRA